MQELAEEETARLFERFGRTFAKQQEIYAEGAEADLCYLIQGGRVRLHKKIRGSERSLTVLGPGDLFGEEVLLARGARSATALALTEVTALALNRTTFGALMAGNQEAALTLVEQLVMRLRRAEEQLENAMMRDPSSRVINTLLKLAAQAEIRDGSRDDVHEEGYRLSIPPLELSSRVGLEVEAVRDVILQLNEQEYLRLDTRAEAIILHDLAALRRLFHLLGEKEEVRSGLL